MLPSTATTTSLGLFSSRPSKESASTTSPSPSSRTRRLAACSQTGAARDVDGVAVALPARSAIDAHAAGRVETVQRVAGDVAEDEVPALVVPGWPFGEAEPGADTVELLAGVGERGRQRWRAHRPDLVEVGTPCRVARAGEQRPHLVV